MTRDRYGVAAIALAAVLFIAVNILSSVTLSRYRLDLTEDKLYTLSEGTLQVIDQLEEPIKLRLFLSDRLVEELPAFRVYATRVRELLEAYAHRADGMIRLEVIDPEPFSDAEEEAVRAGVQGVPLDQTTGEQVYFGLAGTGAADQAEVIPFFQQEREPFLEYDLTKLVYALSQTSKPVIGIVGDVPLEYGPGGPMAAMRGMSEPYIVYEQLQQFFDVRTLQRELDAVAEDITVLVVARPKGLPAKTRYAIDQFVLRGGRALVFVDPWAESAAQQPGPTGRPDPSAPQTAVLPELFASWGLEMPAGEFVADPRLALRVAHGGADGRQRAVPYPAWLAITADQMNGEAVVTGQLQRLNLASAGSLSQVESAQAEFEPLITTSDQAELVSVDMLKGQPDPQALLTTLKGEGAPRVLAARITGSFKTAFPDGPLAQDDGEAAESGDTGDAGAEPGVQSLTESVEPTTLIVIADSDLLEDRFWVQAQNFFGQRLITPVAGNGDLVINAVEALTGSNALIGLRSRAGSARPFELIEDMRRDAAQELIARQEQLQQELQQTERRLRDLQSSGEEGSGALLSAEQRAEIDRFRQKAVELRADLRDLQYRLNQDVERLSSLVKFANIVGIPLLIALMAVLVLVLRGGRHRGAPRARA